MRLRILTMSVILLGACGEEPPAVVPIPPGINVGSPAAAVPPEMPPEVPQQGERMTCRTPDGLCTECQVGQPCYSPTMEASCRANAEFSNDPCPLTGAIGRCTRSNGAIVIVYGGPPRNHSVPVMQAMCQNAMRGTFEAL